MITALSSAAALSAVLAIAAEWNGRRQKIFYLLKPLTTLLIIGIALTGSAGDYRGLVFGALLLSLGGDICLMYEGNGWFIGGLASFLLAHMLFVVAFVHGMHPFNVPLWSALFLLYGLAFFGWLLPKTGKLMLPVMVYGTALMSMAIAASLRWETLRTGGSLLALLGAALFVISDSTLAVRKFKGPYPYAQAVILSTYWASIGLIAASTAVAF